MNSEKQLRVHLLWQMQGSMVVSVQQRNYVL